MNFLQTEMKAPYPLQNALIDWARQLEWITHKYCFYRFENVAVQIFRAFPRIVLWHLNDWQNNEAVWCRLPNETFACFAGDKNKR